jgi:hypothetical protein
MKFKKNIFSLKKPNIFLKKLNGLKNSFKSKSDSNEISDPLIKSFNSLLNSPILPPNNDESINFWINFFKQNNF